MRTELKKLQLDLGVATIYVTHDQVEAMTMADRIMVQKEGVIEQIDTPDELYNHPSNLFVAGFIGSPEMNFVDCTLVKGEKELNLDAKEFKISLPVEESSELEGYVDKEIVMGIRPEELHERISAGDTTERNTILMTLDLIEPVRPYLLLHLKAGQVPFTATVKETKAKAGEEIIMAVDLGKIHLFDKKTTKAIR